MTKKEYMKPTMEVEEIQQDIQLLAGSVDEYGMNKDLLDETVDQGW